MDEGFETVRLTYTREHRSVAVTILPTLRLATGLDLTFNRLPYGNGPMFNFWSLRLCFNELRISYAAFRFTAWAVAETTCFTTIYEYL